MSESTATEAKKLVLFVDDNHESVTEYRETLKQWCHTHLCRSINSAVRFLETKSTAQVSLVVIDLFMPGNHELLDNYASRVSDDVNVNQGQLLAAWLREHWNSLPFVYLSAFPEASSDGSVKCFSKAPVDKDSLVEHICMTLRLGKFQTTSDTNGSGDAVGKEQMA